MGEEPLYRGVPLSQLRIDAVRWDERGDHIRTRSHRQPGDFDVEPDWATEAALDPDRLVRVAGDGSTSSLKIIGRSKGAGRLLKVWVWSDEPEESDEWNGGSAAAANDSDVKKYNEENR